MSTMTLEQVRDCLRAYNIDADEYHGKFFAKSMADAIDAHLRESEEAKAGVTDEPVVIEEVGRVEFDDTGELDIDWSIEGGIHAIGAGTILLVTDRKVTDDEGYGELYVAPMLASARVPDGWQLVPIEPSVEMIDAGLCGCMDNDVTVCVYKSMLAAAPKPTNVWPMDAREKAFSLAREMLQKGSAKPEKE